MSYEQSPYPAAIATRVCSMVQHGGGVKLQVFDGRTHEMEWWVYDAKPLRLFDDVAYLFGDNPAPDLPTVVAAAVRIHGTDLIVSAPPPGRHDTIINAFAGAVGAKMPQRQDDQGFLLSDGAFVGRVIAAQIVRLNDQDRRSEPKDRLYSEDLW